MWVDVSGGDVEDRWRPLVPAEAAIVETMIEDAQDKLEIALEEAGVLAPETSARWQRVYKRVVADMVKRIFQNPEGILEETIDGYRYRRDRAISSGALYVPETDITDLLPRGRRRRRNAFSVRPG